MKNTYPSRMILHVFHLSLLAAPFCSLKSHADHHDKQDFLLAEANHQINSKHDKKTTQRFSDWEYLMYHSADKSVDEKLKLVNDFFNKMDWVEDKDLWEQKDYWATPIESMIRNAGDCEDFSIAKYFTLLALDIPQENLRITYVKLDGQQGHMVLSYFSSPNAEPLILDNVNKNILKRHKRTDLKIIFSFNSDGLWLGNNKMSRFNDTNTLHRWDKMMKRIQQEQA
jgi:predicted transglutaminase-like cysteine proteinase